MESAAQRTWRWAVDGLEIGAELWSEGEITDADVTVRSVHAADGDRELYRTVVQRPDPWDPSLIWITTVDLLRHGESVEAGVAVEQDMHHHRISPSPLQPPLMNLLHQLVQDGAHAGSLRVSPVAQAAVGAEQIEVLVNDVLLNRERRLPVVLFTAIKERDGVYPTEAGDPSLTARELCGLAHVHVIARAEDTHRLTKRLQMLSAYDGAVRIYWPRLRLTDPPPRHPLHLRQRLNASSGPAIIRRVVDAGARSYRPPEGTAVLLSAHRRERERERIDALAAGLEPSQLAATLREELMRAIETNVLLEQEMDTLRQQLTGSGRRVDDLEAQLATLRPEDTGDDVSLAGRAGIPDPAHEGAT